MKACKTRIFSQGAIALAVSLLFQPQPLLANPTGAQVVNGVVSMVKPNAPTLNVTNSPGAIINWQGFSIGAGEVTRFIQQSSSSAVLNRVVGADISSIQGQLLSNGRVFLINPAGILIGPNAMLDTAGFIGSTLNMQNADFLAGKLRFAGDANSGAIINQGWIRTSYGGNVLLVAPRIENSGLIQTPGGELILAAGQKVTVSSLEQEGVQFEVQAPTDSVINIGKLLADGGAVGVFAGTLRHSGDIRANALTRDEGGRIVLKAQGLLEMTDASGTSVAGVVGGKVNINADVVMHTGTVDASGAYGGGINLSARNILSAGTLAADGTAGAGGSVTVQASGRILQTANARLSADGAAGAGGSITLQAQQSVYASGTLSATGSAAGGTIKVLGNDIVLLAAQVAASGDRGGGTVLIGGDYQGSNPDIQNARSTQINFSTRISADARDSGDGGKVVVWSDENTRFAGSISARGGAQAGNGGVIEISGKEKLVFGGLANAGAPNGKPGTLLLDPKNIVIGSASAGGGVTDLVDPNIGGLDLFGAGAVVLTNGNVVAPNSNDDFVATNAGAAYLFNGSSGALIATLTGSQAGDQVSRNGVTALTNGNYVVNSPVWNNGAVSGAGAVTFGNGATGVSGVVRAANSLVGSQANDNVGGVGALSGVTALSNGNYVVRSAAWANGAATNAGAVTFGNGTSGVSGVVSAANSLVGGTTNDQVGGAGSLSGVTVLTNGNYVVRSPNWANGAALGAGAVTFGNGTSGISGVVSAANSLVGSQTNDNVGDVLGVSGVVALTNGNYVVRSPKWANGAATNAGAVTFGNGTTGVSGVVSAANSLVGSTADDQVGGSGVTALTNGNYVVASRLWDNGAVTNAGAVTFGNGASGVSGVVSAVNSLVGTTASDVVGFDGVTALTNGNYVVTSPFWDNGAVADAGAVTFGNGTSGVSGAVSAANSLVGSKAGDQVGRDGLVTALNNGNYVVISRNWSNGAASAAGAVTFGNGTIGVFGVVSAANSLVGSKANDVVGADGVTALTNGNYVVRSASWANGAATNAGAVTFGNGTSGVSGAVSAANSLVGSTANDQVGREGVTALSNGNYVVTSFSWANGAASGAGAVTFGNGTTGVSGMVSAANSLVGSAANDGVGSGGVTALTNGNYVVRSFNWANGGASGAGAVTFGNGTSGVSGAVSAANSLVGSTANDNVGGTGVTVLSNGNYVVQSFNWANGAASGAGAVTFGNGTTGVSGVVSPANSLVGSTANDHVGGSVIALSNGSYVVNSPFWTNGATTSAGAVTFGNGTTGVSGVVSAANSLVGNTANDQVGSGGLTELSGGRVLVRSPLFDNGAVDSGRLQILNGSGGGGDTVASATFANNPGADSTITPASITAITNTGTAVTLQANNDITLTPGSNIVTNNPSGAGGAITMQAGRSVVLNANITTDDANLTITANDPAAQAANRDPGAAALTMASGTAINAGTGVIRFKILGGVAGAASSDITLANLTGTSVSVEHAGPTAGGRILSQTGNPVLTVANTGTVHLEIEAAAGGVPSSIGTSATPIRITTPAGGTARLESHYHGGGSGIFIDALTNVQVGGADPAVFSGSVKGLQTLMGAGAAGPIQLNVTGNLTQLTGAPPICGSGGGGGPICAGPAGSSNASDILTLRANDMLLTMPVVGNSVILLPQASGTIGMAGGTGTLKLSNAEIGLVNTTSLRIGESASGNIVFGGNITMPGTSTTIEFRNGGTNTITTTQLPGATDITANAGATNIRLTAGGVIGATGAGRIKINPGGATLNATNTSGDIFAEQTLGDLQSSKWKYSNSFGAPQFETATTDGNIFSTSGGGTGSVTSVLIAGGANRDIVINGSGSDAGTLIKLMPSGSTIFTGGDRTFNLPISSDRPIGFTGGNATFNQPVTATTGNGSLSINSGKATFNSSSASNFAGAVSVSGSGELAGTGRVNANNGLLFTGGTISNTNASGVTVVGGTNINTGAAILTGKLVTDTLGIASGTLTVNGMLTANTVQISGGTLGGTGAVTVSNAFNWSGGTLAGAGLFTTANAAVSTLSGAVKTLSGKTWDNFGTVNWTGGNVALAGAATTINNKSGATWNILTTGAGDDVNGAGAFNNLAGAVINGNAPGGSNSIHPNVVNHAGTFNLLQGDLDFDNLSTFNFSGALNMSNGTRVIGYTGTGSTLNFNAGSSIAVTGAASFEQNLWNMNVTSPLTLPSGLTLRQTGATLTANAPLILANGATYALSGGTLAGTGAVTVNNGMTWTGGTVSNTGGVTVANGTIINAGAPTLTGTLSTDVLGMTGGTFNIGANGLFTLTGATSSSLHGGTLTNSGTMQLNGAGGLRMLNPGALAVNAGGFLDFRADASILGTIVGTPPSVTNNGTVRKLVTTGTSQIGATGANAIAFTNASTGTINPQTGTIQTSGLPTNAGTIDVESGATFSTNGNNLTNTGTITGKGTIDVGAATLTNSGILRPGTSPGTLTINGNLTLTSFSTTEIDLQSPGTSPGSHYDVINVTGVATLGGVLSVTQLFGFTPSVGQTYNIMNYGSRSGDFASLSSSPSGTSYTTSAGSALYQLQVSGVSFSSPSSSSSSSSSNSTDVTNVVVSDHNRMRQRIPDDEVEQAPARARPTLRECN